MNVISITKLYDLLRSKIGQETAENLTTFIEYKIKTEVDNKSQMLATKEDLYELKVELKGDISDVKSELKDDISGVVKWMFVFWVSQVVATFGFILLFIKK